MSDEQASRRDWTVKELAERAGVDPSAIRHALAAGRLKGYKRAGAWFITDEEARRWLAERDRWW